MKEERTLSLSIPKRQARALSFSDGSVDDLARWTNELPITDALVAGARLRDALVELNRSEGEPLLRFRQMELLRPVAHFICSSFAPTRPRRALFTDEAERTEALLAQTLQFELATGYKIVLVDVLRGGVELASGAARESLAGVGLVALHRALTELAQTLLRSLQRYTPPPPRLWEQLHRLYALAELRGVLDETVRDEENKFRAETRIVDAYIRAAMLGAARPNTLRPATLGTLFAVLEDWARFVDLSTEAPEDEAHAVLDLSGDRPPVAAALHAHRDDEELRVIHPTRLLDVLHRHLDPEMTQVTAGPVMPEQDADELVRHAVQAWGVVTKRVFKRLPVAGQLRVCAGMLAIHYHIACGVPFEDRLTGGKGRRGGRVPARFRTFDLVLADASPGGYGLVCEGDFPEDLQTGDLLGVQKAGGGEWHIAVVRWFGNEPSGSRLGIELLAPRAEPAGARRIATRGSAQEWIPVLLLPELRALHEPAALVTPRGAFRIGQKLALNQGGHEYKVRLEKSRSFADNFHQFTLRELGHRGAHAQPFTGIEVDYLDDDAFEQFDF
ncbi:MAG: hypothetical protein V2J24_07245 [Pseudomonadales bacterium]|nr:hypothetical protein [Pseudomonadales bacterium]